MKRITFEQPRARIEDWRVKVDGATVGSVWRCGDAYRVSVTTKEAAATLEAAFKAARQQVRRFTAA